MIQRNCRVWLKLAAQSSRAGDDLDVDLYDGRLGELKVPVTFMHGRHDPRTEPGEMKRVQRFLPGNQDVRFIEDDDIAPQRNGLLAGMQRDSAGADLAEVGRGPNLVPVWASEGT